MAAIYAALAREIEGSVRSVPDIDDALRLQWTVHGVLGAARTGERVQAGKDWPVPLAL